MNRPAYIINKISLFLIFAMLLTSCSNDTEEQSSLILKDNLLYKGNSNVPFTGRERALVDNKIVEYDVKDGLKHGEFRIYSKEGNIEVKGQLDSNRNVGRWQYFYPDSVVELEGEFMMDLPEGKWIWNYPDGKLREVGYFHKGKRSGIWYQYGIDGDIILEKNYDINDSSESVVDSPISN